MIFQTILWPVTSVFYVLYILVTRFLPSLLGLVLGGMIGLVGGYFFFIHKLPTTVEDPVIPKISVGETIDEKVLNRLYAQMPPWVSNPDYERLDWLNKLIAEMWPYLNKAISASIKESVAPLLAQNKPAMLETLEFQELSLGTLPPAFAGIKSFETHDDEIILQPVLQFAGNPNIIVAASAKGIKATVQLVDVFMTLAPRITIKPLVPVFPCFSRITISLMEKPKIDFGLKAIGSDAMAIPGLYHYVQKAASDTVASMYLWPKFIEVYRDDPKPPIGWLAMRHIRAEGLRNQEMIGRSDPYVKMALDSKSLGRRTSIKWNDLNPDWEGEEYQMILIDPVTQKLKVEVMDKDSGSKDGVMGVQIFSLEGLQPNEPRQLIGRLTKKFSELPVPTPMVPKDVAKEGEGEGEGEAKVESTALDRSVSSSRMQKGGTKKDLGMVHLEIEFIPFGENETAPAEDGGELEDEEIFPAEMPIGGGKIRMVVHSGEYLEGKHHSNPRVKARFRAQEWRSKVYKRNPDPDFDEEAFDFLVDEEPKDEVLHVEVASKAIAMSEYVHPKDAIGYCDIKLNDVLANGRINDMYQLTDSQRGKVKIELIWLKKTEKSTVAGAPTKNVAAGILGTGAATPSTTPSTPRAK